MHTSLSIESFENHRPLSGAFLFGVHLIVFSLSVSFDFQIVTSDVPGISLVLSMNEDAFSFVTDELQLKTLPDGSAPLSNSNVVGFIADAENAHLCSSRI